MKNLSPPDIEKHNSQQISYFEKYVKQSSLQTILPTNSRYIQRQVDEVLHFAGITPNDHILEIGCGMGRCTLPLAQRGIKVEGLDLTPILLDTLRSLDGGRFNIPLHCADILNPPKELYGKFAAVIGFFILHHLHDLAGCFKSIARLLKPGGRVIFLEPNPYNILYYFQIAFTPGMSWQGDKGMLQMRRDVITRAMQSAGLSKFSMTRFGFFPPFLTNRPWGARLEAKLERIGIWRSFLPFQLFKGECVIAP